MAFVRFSRDKRGYEYIYLFQEPTGKGSVSRPRVLYWYRTPPGVKVGREPFDNQVRQALEAQNPDLTFDWKSILQAQAPPLPEAEPWRERRRAERSAKQARTGGRRDQPAAEAERVSEEEELTSARPADEDVPDDSVVPEMPGDGDTRPSLSAPAELASASPTSPSTPELKLGPTGLAARGRRRRRGGRRRKRGVAGTLPVQGSPAAETPAADTRSADLQVRSERHIRAEAPGAQGNAGSGNPDDDETEVPVRTS